MDQISQLKQICYKCARHDHIGCTGKRQARSSEEKTGKYLKCLCEDPQHAIIDNNKPKESKLPWWIVGGRVV